MDYRSTDLRNLWHPYSNAVKMESLKFPVMESARGVRLRDTDGREYLDGISSWWCVNLGHSHYDIVNSVASQLYRMQHSITGGMSHTQVIELSDRLAKVSPRGLNRCYFASDGASAVEAAIRMAIQYWWNVGQPQKRNIISLEGAYHGDTLGTVSLGFLPSFHAPIAHVVNRAKQAPAPDCFHCRFEKKPETCSVECFGAMERLLTENAQDTAAVIAEPLCQGAAGIRIYPAEYISRLGELCRELGVLLILDEIAVGFGRTGAMFATDHTRIEPDLLVVGKSLTGGYLPMSAVLATEMIYDSFRNTDSADRTFYHGHTFSGNPLAAAAANGALRVFSRDDIVEKSSLPASILADAFQGFREIPGVQNTATMGCMSSLLISDEAGGAAAAQKMAALALSKGLIIRPLGAVVYLWPPLITRKQDMDDMVSIFRDCLSDSIA